MNYNKYVCVCMQQKSCKELCKCWQHMTFFYLQMFLFIYEIITSLEIHTHLYIHTDV